MSLSKKLFSIFFSLILAMGLLPCFAYADSPVGSEGASQGVVTDLDDEDAVVDNDDKGVSTQPDNSEGSSEDSAAEQGGGTNSATTFDSESSSAADSDASAKTSYSGDDNSAALGNRAVSALPSFSYRTYLSTGKWSSAVSNGKTSGNTRGSNSVGCIGISFKDSSCSLTGAYLISGETKARSFSGKGSCEIGITDKTKQLSSFSLKASSSSGETEFGVYYRVYLEHYGWLAWASNGEMAGTNDSSLKILAVQIELVNSGDFPSSDTESSNEAPYIESNNLVSISAHVQNIGWMAAVGEGSVAGTTGRGLRMESLRVSLGSQAGSGSVELRGHVAGTGWQGWRAGSCGTTGQGRALEAVCMRLTGAAASQYDIWYRVHCADTGWTGWACNGEEAGSQGFARDAQAVEVRLLPKGSDAPGDTSGAFEACGVTSSAHVQNIGWMAAVGEGSVAGTTGRGLRMESLRVSLGSQAGSGSVELRGHVAGTGWQGWRAGSCGTTGQGRALEAVCMRLTGAAASQYDIWYRVHCADTGWTGWACNGEEAGSQGFARDAQAVEVRLLPKGSDAPGDTSGAFFNKSGQNLKFKVMYGGSEVASASTDNGAFRYVLPSSATPSKVTISYESGSYKTLQIGKSGAVSKGGEVLASQAGAVFGDPNGDTISVRYGSAEVATITLCRSSNIAALYITSDDPVNQGRSYVDGSPDHSLSATGSMTMVDSSGTVVYDGDLTQIKGRGNTTWSLTKKPYQIKLSKKTDLLQSGSKDNKNKTWVLLANAFDMTGLRNLTAYNIASAIGVKSAIESRPVDLFYDGEYRGTYQLCEKVQINAGRVDIHNLEDDIDDLNEDVSSLPRAKGTNKYGNTFQYTKGVVDPEDITGGYLVEYDPGRYTSEASWFKVKLGSKEVAFVCKSPEHWSYAQAKYLSEYFQEAFNAISSGGVNADTGKKTTDYFDEDSVASLYWLCEMALNSDGFNYSSTYIYKDRDGSDSAKLTFGPGWDFDNAFGNPEKFSGALLSTDWWFTRQSTDLGSFLYGDYFLKQSIDSYRSTAVNTARKYLTDGTYNSVAEGISSSLVLNDYLWGSNSETAATLKYWILQRLDWIRSQW